MKHLLKFFSFLIINILILTNITACNQERFGIKELLDKKIVNEIRNFNSKDNWNLVTNKVSIIKIKKKIKDEISNKLSLDLQDDFNQGNFFILDFFDQKNQILSNSYFTRSQTKKNIKFNFLFNKVIYNATINLKINDSLNQDIVDAISNIKTLNVTIQRNLDSGLLIVKNKLVDAIENSLEDNIRNYFFQGKLEILDLFSDYNFILTDEYFKTAKSKIKVIFTFIFSGIKAEGKFNLLVTHVIYDQDIINYIIRQVELLELDVPRSLDNGIQIVKNKLLNAIENSLESKIRHYFFQGKLEILNFFSDYNFILTDEYFKTTKSKIKVIFTFIFNGIKAEGKFNLLVTHVIYDQDIDNHINQFNFLELKMLPNLVNGLSELKSLIFFSIKNSTYDEQLINYIENNFKITNILYNKIKINDDFFYNERSKIKLQFQYFISDNINDGIEIIKTVDFYLSITFNMITNDDIIDIINSFNNFKVSISVQDTNGIEELKNDIKRIIYKNLKNENYLVAKEFDEKKFIITNIKNHQNEILDDNYFISEKPCTDLFYSYKLEANPEFINPFKLIVLVKRTDQEIVDKINSFNNFKITITPINSNGLLEIKKIIRLNIIQTLIMDYEYDDESFKICFEKGNFDIKSIMINSKEITDNFFIKSSFLNFITINYTFNSITKLNNFNLYLTITESNETMINFIKNIFPKKIKVKNKTSTKQLKKILINKIEECLVNLRYRDTIVNTFNHNKNKFKICDFYVECNNKKVIIDNFIITTFFKINHQDYDIEITVSYNSILWEQKIKVSVFLI